MTQRYRIKKITRKMFQGLLNGASFNVGDEVELEPIEEKTPEEKVAEWFNRTYTTGLLANGGAQSIDGLHRLMAKKLIECGIDAENLK